MQTRSAIEHHDSVIGKSIVIKGEIIASVPLHVNGYVEGSISALEQRVTIGSEGKVRADISAGEVVIMGDVCGNLNGCYRAEIRSDGSLTGDLAAERICIHDGAFVKGAIESQKPCERDNEEAHPELEPQNPEAWENVEVSEPA
jgi:cytoskeletal protein CcmA (bactofilin family)